MNWIKPDLDAAEVRRVAERYGVNLLISSILVRRGLTDPISVQYVMENDLRYLHNPFTLGDLEPAVQRMLEAAAAGERVTVFGDRDVDGVTATALMVDTLQELGAEVSWRLPEGDDPYGLTPKVVEEVAAAGAGLLVTVDCGVTAADEIAAARKRGLEVIVVDHHEPPTVVPEALVVDPKLVDSAYPFAHLSACGVVWKVAWALRFARTDLFNETVCLLNVRPLNDSIAIEAVKVTNLVPGERLFEVVNMGTAAPASGAATSTAGSTPGSTPGSAAGSTAGSNAGSAAASPAPERLAAFADGCAVLVYDAPLVRRLLTAACGSLDLFVHDLAPDLAQVHPAAAGKSLLQLREASKLARYSEASCSELDVLAEVFKVVTLDRHRELLDAGERTLDLVALSTIADLMPLRDENRILVKRGLRVLAATERVGLRELLARTNLYGKDLHATEVSFHISPVLNSAGRMGEAGTAARLLLSRDESEARTLVDRLIELNQQRRNVADEAWERAQPEAHASYDRSGGKLVWVLDRALSRGITGMLAARLVDAFRVPAIVVAKQGEEAVGSVRTLPGLPVSDLLGPLDDMLPRWGGHAMAGGFSVATARLPELGQRLQRLAERIDAVELPSADQREVDAEIPPRYLAPPVWETADLFAPYGSGHRPLAFLMRRVRIAQVELIGKSQPGHVKLLLEAGGYRWPGLYWNAAEKVGVDFDAGDQVNIVFRLTRSHYNQIETLQLTILDLER